MLYGEFCGKSSCGPCTKTPLHLMAGEVKKKKRLRRVRNTNRNIWRRYGRILCGLIVNQTTAAPKICRAKQYARTVMTSSDERLAARTTDYKDDSPPGIATRLSFLPSSPPTNGHATLPDCYGEREFYSVFGFDEHTGGTGRVLVFIRYNTIITSDAFVYTKYLKYPTTGMYVFFFSIF